MKGAILLALGAAALIAVLVALDWPARPYLESGDYPGFWVAGRMLLDGSDPYDRDAFLRMHAQVGAQGPVGLAAMTGYAYPLPAALVFAPYSLIPIRVAAPIWLVTQLVLAAVALYALGRELFRATLRRDLPVLYAVTFASQPAWVLAAGGNMGGFVLALAAAVTTLLLRGQYFAAGLVGGLVLVKPHPFVALPLVLLALPRLGAARAILGAVVTAAALMVVTLLLRSTWIAEYLVPLGQIADARLRPPTVFGLVTDPAWLPWLVALSVVVAFAAWACSGPRIAVAVAVALPVSLFVRPYGWSYDQLVLAVPAAIALAVVAHAAPASRAAVLLAIALAVDALAWATYAFAFTVGHEAWSALVPLAVLAVVLLAAFVGRPELLPQPEGEP